jgi:peptidoglycan-associated lipoprotein
MTSTRMPSTALVAGLAALLMAGCSSKPKAAAAPEAKPVVTSASPTAVPEAPPAVREEPRPQAQARVSVDELNRRGYLKDTFFDYDRHEIRQDQRDVLAKDAAWLQERPEVKVMVEGHCDERGTAQYNMALGQQRAQVVKDYLVQLGIDASRIQIISYGKEKPFDTGHDDKAWAQNRRDHFLVTAS